MQFMVEYYYETESPEPEYHEARDLKSIRRRLLSSFDKKSATCISVALSHKAYCEFIPNPHYTGPYRDAE